jgi:hypothetical protein
LFSPQLRHLLAPAVAVVAMVVSVGVDFTQDAASGLTVVVMVTVIEVAVMVMANSYGYGYNGCNGYYPYNGYCGNPGAAIGLGILGGALGGIR